MTKAVICRLSHGQDVIMDDPFWADNWPKETWMIAVASDGRWGWTYYGENTAPADMKPLWFARSAITTARLEDIFAPDGFGTLPA